MDKDYCKHCGNLVDDDGVCLECQMQEEQYNDMVNSPPHYTNGTGIECIDYMRQVLGLQGFIDYCHGNVIKYQHRYNYKGKPVEDLQKAQYYLNKMIEALKEKHK